MKTEFVSEPYFEMPISRKERKVLAQVRCGVAPLRLETGRWAKRNNIPIPSEERVCLNCFKNGFIETEHEEHFLLRCLHLTSKYSKKTFYLRLAQSCHPLII